MSTPVMRTDEIPMLAPDSPMTGCEGSTAAPDRRAVRDARRRERRERLLYAWGGVAVLVLFFVVTVIVVDMVR